MLYSNKLNISVEQTKISGISVCVREVASSGINCYGVAEFVISVPGLQSGTVILKNLSCSSGNICNPINVNITNGFGVVDINFAFNVESTWQVYYGTISSPIIYVNTSVDGSIKSNYMCNSLINPVSAVLSTSSSQTSSQCSCK